MTIEIPKKLKIGRTPAQGIYHARIGASMIGMVKKEAGSFVLYPTEKFLARLPEEKKGPFADPVKTDTMQALREYLTVNIDRDTYMSFLEKPEGMEYSD